MVLGGMVSRFIVSGSPLEARQWEWEFHFPHLRLTQITKREGIRTSTDVQMSVEVHRQLFSMSGEGNSSAPLRIASVEIKASERRYGGGFQEISFD